ncbi:MAG: carbohydrate kinase [Firmicutes bacterium]|nr:carbohydrate kinase [Bacillota bacterium]
MTPSFDIVTVGEALIDFVSRREPGADKLNLEGNPGGAPANVLSCAARLGKRTAIVTKVGSDGFGSFLQEQISRAGVCTDYMISDPLHPTTLAMVTLDATGNRSFGFYRTQTADVMLSPEDLPYDVIAGARIFHFGSVTMTAEPARSATFAAARYAKEHGVFVSYDPNLRKPLWSSLSEAKEAIEEGLRLADAVKLSDDEMEFLMEGESLEQRAVALVQKFGIRFLIVTMGPKGCFCVCGGQVIHAKTYANACVDTTGAGDAFWGATLTQFLETEKAPWDLSREEITSLLQFSNAAGSLATTKYGAIPAMPTREQIHTCIETASYLE